MKFKIPVEDHELQRSLKTGIMNGATVWLNHLCHTLEAMGHEAKLVPLYSDYNGCDYVIVQSEWTDLFPFNTCNEKKIVILGHFMGGNYPSPDKISADLFISTWKGPVVDQYKHKVHFFTHAYCDVCDDDRIEYRGDIVWAGTKYSLRDEGWFLDLPVTRISGEKPHKLNAIYRGALVCPNIHGDFQKGIISSDSSRIATVPGYAVNERLFQIIGAGGFQVADNAPQIKEFFDDDELVTAKTPEEFREKIMHFTKFPEERIPYIERGRKKILEQHTYRHRVKQLLELL